MSTFFQNSFLIKKTAMGMTVGKHIERIGISLFEWKSNVLLLEDMRENILKIKTYLLLFKFVV